MGALLNTYDDIASEVYAQTGTDEIRIIFRDTPAVRYIEVTENLLVGISEEGKWTAAHFHRLRIESVREFEDMVESHVYPAPESKLEKLVRVLRSVGSKKHLDL